VAWNTAGLGSEIDDDDDDDDVDVIHL